MNDNDRCEGDDWCHCDRCQRVYGDIVFTIDGTCKIDNEIEAN